MNYVFFIIFFVVYCRGAACDAEIIFIPCVFPQFFENPKHKDKAQLSGIMREQRRSEGSNGMPTGIKQVGECRTQNSKELNAEKRNEIGAGSE